jgi:hypothetical protein
VQQVKRILMFSGDVVPAVVDKTLSGRRLNINGSLQSLAESDEVPPGPAISFQINYQNGRTLNVGWLCNGDDDDFGGGPAALYELSFTDSAPGSTPIILKGVIPFSPNTTQTTNVTIPYRHTAGTLSLKPFDNRGNEGIARTLSVNVPLLVGDPYLPPAVGGQVALSTNTAELLELDADDVYVDFIFPSGFSFPFFGESHTEAKISSNGALYFGDAPVRPCPMNNPNCEPEADDVPSAPRALGGFKMIAGLWEDLTLETSLRPNAGVYVVHPNANSIIFRWQAKPCNFDLFLDECTGGTDVNFEIELRTDGTIKTRYGSGNTPLLPTVGIGGGNPDAYVVPTHTSDEFPINLTNAGEVTFTPRAPWSATTLASAQAEMKAWTIDGRTSAYVKLTFPDAGYRVANWGTPARVGNDFSVDATIEKFNGASAQANTSTAQIWDLGPLSAGNYTFTFKNSGTNVKTLNFTVGGAVVPNPIDTAREFVRWQYKDFLRREPDGPGWDHWEGEITQCSDPAKRFPGETEPQCVQRKRANTSAAFFLSPEFQNTGYFVLRVYRGSLGRMPHFGGSNPPDNVKDEFTRDAATVSQGIVVNDQLDPAVINANKQAFVEAFVTRPEFRTIYDPLNDTQYVDRLFQTTGVTPTSGERQALITEAGAPNGRASVLFKVVDGTTTIANGALVFNTPYGKAFYDNLFNAAFVQMEYFGYLLRDPDEAGYAFWLGKLNQFGNWVDAQMVLAFIKSPEYRSRFGQP